MSKWLCKARFWYMLLYISGYPGRNVRLEILREVDASGSGIFMVIWNLHDSVILWNMILIAWLIDGLTRLC